MNQLLAMRAFVRLVETESFGKAAERLGMPRSTLSKLVSDLEAHLGTRLVHRTTRTVAISTEGKFYYDRCIQLLEALDSMDNSLRGTESRPHGHLRIDAPAAFADRVLIPRLPEFHQLYPDITLALGIGDRNVNVVGEGVDCAIRLGELPDSSMIARKITDLDYLTCASPEYLARYGTPTAPEQAHSQHKIIGYFSAASGLQEALIFEKDGAEYSIKDSCFSSNSGDGIIELMLAGLGLGQPLRMFVQPQLDEGKLIPVLEEWHRQPVPLSVVWPQNRHQSPRVKAFIRWVMDAFG